MRAGVVAWLLALTLLLAAVQEPNRAALVVRFDDERVETRCVAFDEPALSGYELLQRSGLPLTVDEAGLGISVCRVDGVGCPSTNCFCQCQGEPCVYWSYWHQVEGEWRYSAAGAAAYQVSDRAVEGWSWGPGSVDDATAPPAITFAEVCTEEAPASAATPPAAVTPAGAAWLLYGLFALLALGLLVALLRAQRRRVGS